MRFVNSSRVVLTSYLFTLCIFSRWHILNTDIIENLKFLIASAESRGVEQGIKTYSYYIDRLTNGQSDKSDYDDLYRELSSLQRFADFNDREWQAVLAIFNAIETGCR